MSIYEEAFIEMHKLLEETINGWEKSFEAQSMIHMFSISNRKFEFMNIILHFSHYQALRVVKNICVELCKSQGVMIKENVDLMNIDFIVEHCGKNIGYFITLNPNFMPEIADAMNFGLDEVVNIVLQESINGAPIFYKPNSYKYRQYPFRSLVKNLTLRQFFEEIGVTDYKEFKEYVERYNFEIEQLMGMTVSPLPTQKTLERHKVKVREELLSYFFEEKLHTIFTEQEIIEMKKWFLKNYEVLLSNADFANSFVSSEWYYDFQVKTDVGLDQTAIVAGYLKSIEQILCSILLTLKDEYPFYFKTNKQGEDHYKKDSLQLTYENLPYIKTMARDMLYKIKGKKDKVCYRNTWTDQVIEFLLEYIGKDRNGYLHKDNLYEWDKIVGIREKTYCAYFMILSTFKINKEQLSSVHLTKK